jgi:heme exporter protein C
MRLALAVLRPALAVIAFGMLGVGTWLALSWAPAEVEMGDVQRIMYAHVPAVWMAFIGATLNFGCSIGYLFRHSWKLDALAEASAEVGLLFGTYGVALGSIWGKPTWNVWWTWDPRLTTAAIMLVSYAGYLALRKFVEDPERRAIWSSVVAIIAYVDVPIIWFSVQWWNSLHQVQSSPKTVDPSMVFVLRWNAFAMLAFLIFFIWSRYRIALHNRQREVALPEAIAPGQASPIQTSGALR